MCSHNIAQNQEVEWLQGDHQQDERDCRGVKHQNPVKNCGRKKARELKLSWQQCLKGAKKAKRLLVFAE
jgi:hypothetical protein